VIDCVICFEGIDLLSLMVQVTIVGYNHKLKLLLGTIVDKIVKFEVRPDRFAVIKVNEIPLLCGIF